MTDANFCPAKALTSIVKDRVGKLQQLAKEKGADKLGGASKVRFETFLVIKLFVLTSP